MAGFNSNQVRLQIGVQTAKGTSVPATKRMAFVEKRSLKTNYKKEELQSLGQLEKVSKVIPIRVEPTGSIEGVVNPEETFLFFRSLLGDDLTPVNAGGKYSWIWTNPVDFYNYWLLTMEFVDAQAGGVNYKTVDTIIKSFEFKVSPEKVMRYSADFVALSLASASATNLTEQTVTPALPRNTKIYIDNAGSEPFTTEFTQGGIELTLKYDNSAENVPYIGTSDIELKEPECELSINMRWASVAKGIFDAELATGTAHKIIGFKNIDPVTGLGVAVWFAGQVKELPELPADNNGVIAAKYVFAPVTDTVNGGWLHVEFINTTES